MTTGTSLSSAQRARLAALLDVLFPAGAGLPAASTIDIQHDWIDQAIAAAPAMAPALLAAIAAPGEPAVVIDALRSEQPAAFLGFALLTAGAYLMHPAARAALGYDGIAVPARPPLEGEAEYYLEDGLLEPVLARGAFYRRVPDDAG